MEYKCKYCGEVYPYQPVMCNDCGTPFSLETFDVVKSTREEALEYWNELSLSDKTDLAHKHLKNRQGVLAGIRLTWREIELIWEREKNEKAFKEYLDSIPDDKISVDDDMGVMPQPNKKEIYETDEYKSACRAEWEDYDNKNKEKDVDFKLLLKTLHECAKGEIIACDKEVENLNLFINLLSTEPTFAKKTYEELNKLN